MAYDDPESHQDRIDRMRKQPTTPEQQFIGVPSTKGLFYFRDRFVKKGPKVARNQHSKVKK